MFKRLIAVGAAALVTVATYAVAQELREGHPDIYVVQKGDTLWDIAGRFLKRPWLWPEIWQANPQIENPHLIYPGDVISLAYLNGQARLTTQPGPRREAMIDTIPLSEIEPFLRKLRVVDSFEEMPYVVGLEETRLRAAAGQVAYVRGLDAEPGQMVAIVRPTQRYGRTERKTCCPMVRQDDLDFRGDIHHKNWEEFWVDSMVGVDGKDPEFLGYELMELTTGVVTRGTGAGIDVATVALMDEGREVREGDRIVPVEPQAFDLQFLPHASSEQAPYAKLQIMSVADGLQFAGPRYVVAISGGAVDGIDNGTVFSIWTVGESHPDKVKHRNSLAADGDKVRLPDEYVGHVMVFRTYDKVSYGLVMDGIKQAGVGDVLKHPDATR